MNHNVLNAALALETLNNYDREWVLSRLNEHAIEQLKTAQIELDSQNISELVEQIYTDESKEKINFNDQKKLLADREKIINLLKNEPDWMRNCILGLFGPEGQAKLSCENNIVIEPIQITPKLFQTVSETLIKNVCRDGDKL